MGAALARTVLGIESPRVGLLSNGHEVVRGSELVLEAHATLTERAARSDALTFVGNVEGDGVTAGIADVVVTDGFTGNVALKLIEGVSQTILGAIRDIAYASPRTRAGGLLLRAGLQRFRDQIDPEEQGGAYLLGLRRLGVVPHGRFTRVGFARAIERAALGAREDVVGRTHAALEAAGALRPPPATEAAVRGPATAPGAVQGAASGPRVPPGAAPPASGPRVPPGAAPPASGSPASVRR
jgi:glycerol-3-phosphate acyltransferase PlsX